MTPVELRPEAVAEIHEAHEWYLSRNRDAAAKLSREISAAIERIAADPLSLPAYDESNRYLQIHTFPYKLVFRQHPRRNIVEIIAFAHLRRRPRYWKTRER